MLHVASFTKTNNCCALTQHEELQLYSYTQSYSTKEAATVQQVKTSRVRVAICKFNSEIKVLQCAFLKH